MLNPSPLSKNPKVYVCKDCGDTHFGSHEHGLCFACYCDLAGITMEECADEEKIGRGEDYG